MTPEEIRDEAKLRSPDPIYIGGYYSGYERGYAHALTKSMSLIESSQSSIEEDIELRAEKKAKDFADWIRESCLVGMFKGQDLWFKEISNGGYAKVANSTEELYEIYQKEIKEEEKKPC
jgi:hypothetical protein